MRAENVGPTAALAGIPVGLQARGIWAGYPQIFVRFAGEAETATKYTARALANEIKRATQRGIFHSISIGGRDPLGNSEYLSAALSQLETSLPVMLDDDGQRPEEIAQLKDWVSLLQVSLEGSLIDHATERPIESLQVAAAAGMQQALVVVIDERTSDSHVLRIVERAHEASPTVSVVLHPGLTIPLDRDRRWTLLVNRLILLHQNVRLVLPLPPPTGIR